MSAPRRTVERWAPLLLLALSSSSEAAAQTPARILRNGQEDTVVAMLGGAEGFAGCHFEQANVVRDHVVATFECSGGASPFTLELRPRAPGPCEGTCTETLVVVPTRGSPGPDFLHALGGSIRRGEGGLRWSVPRRDEDANPFAWRSIRHVLVLLGLAATCVYLLLGRRARTA